jgi:hypothetical protein
MIYSHPCLHCFQGHLTITNDVEGTQAVRRRLQTMANQLKKYSGDLMQSARTAPGLYELLVSCPLEAVQKAGEAVKAQVRMITQKACLKMLF